MNNPKELAHKIAVLQDYTYKTGVKTTRSQAELLKDLNVQDTVTVLELVAAELRSAAGPAGR
jgi:hypothetical protein